MSSFIVDNNLLWLCVEKQGTPPAWEPGHNYQIGDVVVPRNPTPGQVDLAFQVVSFIGKTGGLEPTWPTEEGQTVVEENLEWISALQTNSPVALEPSEFFVIDKQITVT